MLFQLNWHHNITVEAAALQANAPNAIPEQLG
jgi:hypothetical protein